jgi:hypothetical protein
MGIELLVFAIIFYFVMQAASNIVLAMRGGLDASQDPAESVADHGWEGPSPAPRRDTPYGPTDFWGRDVEDATFKDVGGRGA